ncbi:hypothetical protein [Wenzhouxiangella sp. EGI_FJ10409]|uniref:hypothetical protein n=1 Tax=Wenzhouxiangella sp. EGI_FJ10409 TaxID=3243767 RepID=UPI0035E2341E
MNTTGSAIASPEVLHEVAECPLCGSAARETHSVSSPNLYSEKLAELAGIGESELIEQLSNVQCVSCGLVYKRRWFSRSLLETLFREAVPWHPKGWDAISGRFTPDNFFAELELYESTLQAQDKEQAARWRRALLSIIDSIPALDNHPERPAIDSAIERGDCDAVREKESLIRSTMDEPAPFKRFAGFRSRQMWDWCLERTGAVKAYAEVGCPLWGMLPIAKSRIERVAFLARPEPNYWGNACRMEGQGCTVALRCETGIEQQDWDAVERGEFDLIGLFQYLDHLENPFAFMKELFIRARSCALVLDHFSQPTAIQHFTGWTPRAIEWLANKFGKRVDDGFEPIQASGNRLYLLT